jgi:5-methylcytosine-specific restriction endonuclease McrA
MMAGISLIKRADIQNEKDLGDFLQLFSRARNPKLEASCSEIRKFELLPLVFSLIPRSALSLSPVRGGFRPVIVEHLVALGISEPADDLVLAIKHICEQIVLSSKELAEKVGLPTKRKYGVADLRAQGLYASLEQAQHGRCAVCGVLLVEAPSIELDHIIPFYLMGDLADGRNWQLLCGPCNNGKRAHLSAMQAMEAWDWIPPQKVVEAANNSVSLRTRFVTLATRSRCTMASCGLGPRDIELRVVQAYASALPVTDLLDVLCVNHADGIPEQSLDYSRDG